MFSRNENRNERTFAKTTLLETALLSPNDPFWCWQKGGFQKGGFGGCSPGTKTGTRVRSPKPPFYKTALLSPRDLKLAGPCSQNPEEKKNHKHKSARTQRVSTKGVSMIRAIFDNGGGLVFCLLFWLFKRQKQHILAISRREREKGKERKGRPKLVVLFLAEKCTFSPILSQFLPKT